MKKIVYLGMSGGVDSSIAAFLLREEGYDVHAIFMKNWKDEQYGANTTTCSAADDFDLAEKVCVKLNIELTTINFATEYWNTVFTYMLDEYSRGYTPNPDVICNKEIKFKVFLDYAEKSGADFIATGHYARIVKNKFIDDNSIYELHKAIDTNKDQTYFLHALNQRQLSKSIFPIGDLRKPDVRALAKKLNLPNFDKKSSTGICFIGEKKFGNFMKNYSLAKSGPILTDTGEELGQHNSLMLYTIGQRQGLGIGGRCDGIEAPWYVIKKDVAKNALIVSQNKNHSLLLSKKIICEKFHWISGIPEKTPFTCKCKVRYRQLDQLCTVITTEVNFSTNCVVIEFDTPQLAVAEGQFAVLYDLEGSQCLGGGRIASDMGLQ